MSKVTVTKKVETLLDKFRAMPQVDCQEKHFFGPGLYIKQVTMR